MTDPMPFKLGKAICDNRTNQLVGWHGKITHVPCLAHVLNLVVQHFLVKYSVFREVLWQARTVFLKSYPPGVCLGEMQWPLN